MKHKAAQLSLRGMGVPPMHSASTHGRDAHTTRKILVILLPALLLFLVMGCREPDYRTEVTGNGEGGVEVHRVPKDPSEMPAQQSPTSASNSAIERRIEVLEATVLRQQEEIAALRRELSGKGAPATLP